MPKQIFCLLLSLFAFFATVQAEEDSIIVCDNGLEMFYWDLDFIKEAKHSIEFAACFAGGYILDDLLDAIEERLKVCPELQVHILTTPTLFEKSNQKRMEYLSKTYPNNFHYVYSSDIVVVWPNLTGIDNHVKMLVVDETYYACGGTNYAEFMCTEGTYTPPRRDSDCFLKAHFPAGSRDQDIVGRGEMAKELRTMFYKLYFLWQHYAKTERFEKDPEKFANNDSIISSEGFERPFALRFEASDQLIPLAETKWKLLLSGPYQKKNPITEAYVNLIKNAKHEIYIHNMYFCPVEPIMKALIDAVNRGVKLTVITNGISDIAPSYTQYFCWCNRLSYVPVFYGGHFHLWDAWKVAKKKVNDVRIFEYHVKDVLFHKKSMLVDGQYFVVGSYNLGPRSHMGDYEMVVVIDSQEIAQSTMTVFEKDLQYTNEISPEKARKWYFDPFTSYLGEVQKKFHGLM